MSRGASCLGGIAALWLFGSTAGAQVSESVDLNVSDIRYDLFQASTALAISPTFAFDSGWTSITARGTVLRFASGHPDLHGSLVGTTFTPALGPFRLQMGADLGASEYLTFPTFTHWFGAADLHYLRPHYGAWVGATGGRNNFAGAAGTVAAGIWGAIPWATLTLTAAHSSIGDTSYTDLAGKSQLSLGQLAFDGRLGTRVGGTGGGRGVYGEFELAYAVTKTLSAVFGAGRYPTDPTRGTIAGRYLTLGIRIGTAKARRAPSSSSSVMIVAGRLHLHVGSATRVEVMGDFTDWAPVALMSDGAGEWRLDALLSPGPHLMEIRVDGGPWVVPAGATAVRDEFGGQAGLFVVPS